MKTIILFAFALMTYNVRSQDATEITNNLNDGVAAVDTAAKEKYEEEMLAFEQEVKDAVKSHEVNVKQVTVGEFQILIQNNCVIEFPKIPEEPTVTEKECFKAQVNAETTAGLIAKATPLNPPSVSMVIRAMNTCELEVSWIKEFEIFNTCWDEEIPAQYKAIYDAQVVELEAKGFVLNEETGKWVKEGSVQKITLHDSGNQIAVPVDQATP